MADVVVSNCVLNLLPRKDRIFHEIRRVLRPGGRFCVSDIVIDGEFPRGFIYEAALYAGCIATAIGRDEYLAEIAAAGFRNIKVERTKRSPIPDGVINKHLTAEEAGMFREGKTGIYSITVTGKK